MLAFCVITDGRRDLGPVLEAIFAQLPGADVVVAGVPPARDDIVPVPLPAAAVEGRLGALRNAAVVRARGEWLVLLDDDIVLADDYVAAFARRTAHAPIVTARVLLPDGTRYWDHATCGGPRGHVLLQPDEVDERVYMTGGGGWVMHRDVARRVRWDDARGFYRGEDTDFAARCRDAGFAIAHEPRMRVLHAAREYTSVGRVVWKRTRVRDAGWVAALRADAPELLLARAATLHARQAVAEAADCLRAGMQWHPDSRELGRAWRALENAHGGAVVGSSFHAAATGTGTRQVPSLV